MPKNYKVIFPMFNITLQTLENYALRTNNVNDIYFHLKKSILKAFSKCEKNKSYCDDWLAWFKNKKSTIHLRELLKKVSCDYWENLINSNAIDTLDALQDEIINKIKCNEKTS